MTKKDPKFEVNPEIRSVRAKLRGFFDEVQDTFQTRDAYEALNAKKPEDKNAIRVALHREAKAPDSVIEGLGKYGYWRVIDNHVDWDDLSKLDGELPEGLKLYLPMGLNEKVSIFPGDLFIVAGVKSCGKTGFLLETAMRNAD